MTLSDYSCTLLAEALKSEIASYHHQLLSSFIPQPPIAGNFAFYAIHDLGGMAAVW